MKTRKEVEELKENWKNDPCWDIEQTEGFEEHYDELLSFREADEAERKNIYAKKRLDKSRKLGIEGNYQLLDYIEFIEKRISKLEESE